MKKFLYEGFCINILFHMEPNIGSLNPYSLATSFFSTFALPLDAEFFLPFVFLPLGAGFFPHLPCPPLAHYWISVYHPSG
jgi:hypothetical protein